MNRAWVHAEKAAVPPAVQREAGGHLLVAELLARRGILDACSARAFLDPGAYQPAPPEDLPGLGEAVEHIERAIRSGAPICVWGDFDADGQTATALLVSALCGLGGKVSYHIPVREYETHGVSVPILEPILAAGARLILTCDTGVSAQDAVEAAHRYGAEMIISDHHKLPAEPPQADALVNPRLLPNGHPLSGLPGVGVAYKLAEALFQRAGRADETGSFLDLAALGIVADLAEIRADTRYLLQLGLRALQETQRPGLQEIFGLAELNSRRISEEHIGFVIGPRLNALGRLSDANPAVDFLTTTDRTRARILALELEGLNTRRRLLSDQVFQAAQAQIERDPGLLERACLVLAHPGWPAGVIGIVASRLVERYQRPVVLIAAPPDVPARGSARSVEGCDITAAIARQQELLQGFGGHPMAAGLSLDPQNIPEFQRALDRTVREMQAAAPFEPKLAIDATLSLGELTPAFVAEIERLAPFGPGNPAPVFCSRSLTMQECTPVGRTGEHLSVVVRDAQGAAQKVIWWQAAESRPPAGTFDLAYTARLSDFRGQPQVQIEWIEAQPVEAEIIRIEQPVRAMRITDYRQEAGPLETLRRIEAGGDVLVWREGASREAVRGVDREELRPARSLAIWTCPPGNRDLQQALARVQPQEVFLFRQDPGLDRPGPFLQQLAALVKYALRAYQGKVSPRKLAAATGQRVESVSAGLEWLAARGMIRIGSVGADGIENSAGGDVGDTQRQALETLVKALLEETASYRAYYAQAAPESLFPDIVRDKNIKHGPWHV